MKFTFNIFLLFIFALLYLSSCDNNVAIGDQSTIIFPTDKPVSFQDHINPFVKQKCAYSGCHSDYSRAGGRRFTDYYTYFETANLGFVIGGNPDASLFMQVLDGRNPHLLNYRIANPTQNQIDGVKAWIKLGAILN
ncbi:MAG: hypothetical protein NTW25_02985 [Candidatus Kapabacteria bacterium]|nr:hypothetical protein [Candidatus Kapabacteria bacterium]